MRLAQKEIVRAVLAVDLAVLNRAVAYQLSSLRLLCMDGINVTLRTTWHSPPFSP